MKLQVNSRTVTRMAGLAALLSGLVLCTGEAAAQVAEPACDYTLSGSKEFSELQSVVTNLADANADGTTVLCLASGTRVFDRFEADTIRIARDNFVLRGDKYSPPAITKTVGDYRQLMTVENSKNVSILGVTFVVRPKYATAIRIGNSEVPLIERCNFMLYGNFSQGIVTASAATQNVKIGALRSLSFGLYAPIGTTPDFPRATGVSLSKGTVGSIQSLSFTGNNSFDNGLTASGTVIGSITGINYSGRGGSAVRLLQQSVVGAVRNVSYYILPDPSGNTYGDAVSVSSSTVGVIQNVNGRLEGYAGGLSISSSAVNSVTAASFISNSQYSDGMYLYDSRVGTVSTYAFTGNGLGLYIASGEIDSLVDFNISLTQQSPYAALYLASWSGVSSKIHLMANGTLASVNGRKLDLYGPASTIGLELNVNR